MAEAWYEKAFGAHYPLLYAHRDRAEAERCLELLPRLAPFTVATESPTGQALLDLGCGDGRHLEILRARGLPAVGLDLSAALLAAAAANLQGAPNAPLVRGDMRRLPFPDGVFAAVLSLFTAFGYFGPPAAHAAPLVEIARVLAPGGHWFLDYFDGDRVRADLAAGAEPARERELAPLSVREEIHLEEGGSVVSKAVELRPLPGQAAAAAALGVGREGLSYTERVAVFEIEELDDLAAGAGLTRVAAAGDYDGRPLGSGSRWILVYRRMTKGGAP